MTDAELNHLYFEWLYRLVCDDRYGGDRASYKRLLTYLFEEPFDLTNKQYHDEARACDGIDLRYQFGYREGIEERVTATVLDCRPCSMLEMMVALCYSCESVAADNAKGDRIGQWFWVMLYSLGLAGMNDRDFDIFHVREVLDRFAENDYAKNGDGGLFILQHADEDVRTKEIWWQACHYLNENGF